MKATEAKLLQILGAVSQFIIPIYQRTYSWTLKECQQLWADILRAGATEEIGVHFIGSVVHVDEGLGSIAVQAPKLVIGGQQRLRLSLIMPFPDLDDPKGVAKNVTGIGRWGNGDVEIGVASLDEVPYAVGLIRQSLERQLEDNGATG
jgi:hypothetical protein